MIIRFQVRCPRGSGPRLYIDGKYSDPSDPTTARLAKAIGFPPVHLWPFPHWSTQRLAWHTALCYRLRGQFGAKTTEVRE